MHTPLKRVAGVGIHCTSKEISNPNITKYHSHAITFTMHQLLRPIAPQRTILPNKKQRSNSSQASTVQHEVIRKASQTKAQNRQGHSLNSQGTLPKATFFRIQRDYPSARMASPKRTPMSKFFEGTFFQGASTKGNTNANPFKNQVCGRNIFKKIKLFFDPTKTY